MLPLCRLNTLDAHAQCGIADLAGLQALEAEFFLRHAFAPNRPASDRHSDVSHFPASAADGVASVAVTRWPGRSMCPRFMVERHTLRPISVDGPQAQQQKSPACAGLSGTTGLDQADLRRRAAKPIPTRPKPISASVAGSGICLVNEPSLCV